MEKKLFGTRPTGEEIYSYTLKNSSSELEILTRGATVRRFVTYGVDIIGGYDSVSDYLIDTSHQGGTIGRIANRVAKARFVMDGKTYNITKNDGENSLHGGDGFDHRMFTVKSVSESSITLTYLSRDGEEGFPANLSVEATYTLLDSALAIEYKAIPDGKTPISMTNHSYFNLDGFGGKITDHVATIYADTYTAVDDALIPNGEHPSVSGTPFDFREPHAIGERIGGDFVGYDHNYVLNPKFNKEFLGKKLDLAASVSGKALTLSVYTDQPCIQFYIGNFLGDGPDFKGGIKPIQHGAFCLETQTEPNSVNHGVGFYSAGDVYSHTTVYAVSKK